MENRQKENGDRFDLAVGVLRLLLVLSVILYLADRKAGLALVECLKILGIISAVVAGVYLVALLVMHTSREPDSTSQPKSDQLPAR